MMPMLCADAIRVLMCDVYFAPPGCTPERGELYVCVCVVLETHRALSLNCIVDAFFFSLYVERAVSFHDATRRHKSALVHERTARQRVNLTIYIYVCMCVVWCGLIRAVLVALFETVHGGEIVCLCCCCCCCCGYAERRERI